MSQTMESRGGAGREDEESTMETGRMKRREHWAGGGMLRGGEGRCPKPFVPPPTNVHKL